MIRWTLTTDVPGGLLGKCCCRRQTSLIVIIVPLMITLMLSSRFTTERTPSATLVKHTRLSATIMYNGIVREITSADG